MRVLKSAKWPAIVVIGTVDGHAWAPTAPFYDQRQFADGRCHLHRQRLRRQIRPAADPALIVLLTARATAATYRGKTQQNHFQELLVASFCGSAQLLLKRKRPTTRCSSGTEGYLDAETTRHSAKVKRQLALGACHQPLPQPPAQMCHFVNGTTDAHGMHTVGGCPDDGGTTIRSRMSSPSLQHPPTAGVLVVYFRYRLFGVGSFCSANITIHQLARSEDVSVAWRRGIIALFALLCQRFSTATSFTMHVRCAVGFVLQLSNQL